MIDVEKVLPIAKAVADDALDQGWTVYGKMILDLIAAIEQLRGRFLEQSEYWRDQEMQSLDRIEQLQEQYDEAVKGAEILNRMLDKAKAENAELRKAIHDSLPTTYTQCACGRYGYKQPDSKCWKCQVEEMQALLAEYGGHSPGCSAGVEKGRRCRCGWDREMQALKGGE